MRQANEPLTPDQRRLAGKWVGLVYAIAGRYHLRFPGLDRDDLYTAGHEALIASVKKFDPEFLGVNGEPVRFGTYLGAAVRRAMSNEGARQRANGFGQLTVAIKNKRVSRAAIPVMVPSLPERTPWAWDEDSEVEPERDGADNVVDILLKSLDQGEADVIRMVMYGRSIEDCAVQFGETPVGTRTRYNRAIKKLRRRAEVGNDGAGDLPALRPEPSGRCDAGRAELRVPQS